ncbi:hypothetical protein LIER_00954 [Lithospermum erythrorhizon]|uniref:Uncharacterized protein n=1 Tax=Lithospermum erythrorhizon TaxID=34254 RepID=A0AAV3NLM4_LITER
MQPPREYKDIEKLTVCLAALNRFIFKSGMNNPEWILFVDGARNKKGLGAGILIHGLGIKKNLIQSESMKGAWIHELLVVLWSLKTTPSDATLETPFNLVYGLEAVLPAEARLPTYRQLGFDEVSNDQRIREELNFVDELRPGTYELENLNGDAIPRTWHASKLAKYYV